MPVGLWKSRRGYWSSSWKQDLDLGPRQEQQALLTALPCLQFPKVHQHHHYYHHHSFKYVSTCGFVQYTWKPKGWVPWS